MSIRRIVAAAVLVAALGLAACDNGPSGPGSVSGTVTGSAQLGAVVVDVVWPGVDGFRQYQGLGNTRVYWAPVPGVKNRHRLVLVDPAGGELRFEILVDDVYLEGPTVTVVSAAGTDNLPRPVSDLRVVLER